MKKYLYFLVIIFIYCSGGSVSNPFQSIPKHVLGWNAVEEDIIYDRETLYEYINGGAEMYRAYDFRQVFVRRYQGPGDDEITVDVYDMSSSADAFGIFSLDRTDPEAGIGQGSGYGLGMLRFWKGRYFVSIFAVGDEEKAEPVILEIGRMIADAIQETGTLPMLLDRLPETGLKKDRTSYFHSDISLSNRFFVASENILNLDNATNGAFAEYTISDDDVGYLLLIEYPDSTKTDAAYTSFLESYMPEAGESGAAEMEDGAWTVAKVDGRTVAIVFEAPDQAWALALLSAIQ